MNDRYRQSVTVSAKTVDEAIAEAERALGVSRDRLDITVITEGKQGFLGMRSENARILAVVIGEPPVPPVAEPAVPAVTGRAAEEQAPFEATDEDLRDDVAATVLAGPVEESAAPRRQQRQETAQVAQEIVENLLRHLGVYGRVSVRSSADPIVLDIETNNGGLLIGRRGETLSALQYLVNVLVGKRTRRWTKVVLDVEHWRDRREETLRALAMRQAQRVRQQQRPVALDPMPANERRIVHLALQSVPDVETHSEGEEPHRRLIISPKR